MLNILKSFLNQDKENYNFSVKNNVEELVNTVVNSDARGVKDVLDVLTQDSEYFDINDSIMYENQQTTLLHMAVKRSTSATVGVLLEYGINPNLLDERGYSAIAEAVEPGVIDKMEKITLLSKAGANLDHFCIVACNKEIAAAIRVRPNPYEKNSDGGFKLFDEVFGFTTDQMPWEFYERNRLILQAALDNGFDINAEDELNHSVATHLIEMFGAHNHLYKNFECSVLPKEPFNSCNCAACEHMYPIVHWALDMGMNVTAKHNGKPLKRHLKNKDNNNFWTIFESEHHRRFGANETAAIELERIMKSV